MIFFTTDLNVDLFLTIAIKSTTVYCSEEDTWIHGVGGGGRYHAALATGVQKVLDLMPVGEAGSQVAVPIPIRPPSG